MEFLFGFVAAGLGSVEYAVIEVIVEQPQANRLQCFRERADLCQDVHTVFFIIDHFCDPARLSFNPLHPVEVSLFF